MVTDFGLARLESGEDRRMTLTAHAGVVGTPAYLAPEQVEGKEITGAVDIYALGIVLYEMLTGTVPFVGDTALSVAVRRLQESAGLAAGPRARPGRALGGGHPPLPGARPGRPLPLGARRSSRPSTGPALPDRPPNAGREPVPAAGPCSSPPPAAKNKLQLIALAALLLLAVGVGWFRYRLARRAGADAGAAPGPADRGDHAAPLRRGARASRT